MFSLPKLSYAYNALEPHIDAKTMEIHYTKHHQGYVDKLNAAVKGTKFSNMEIEELLKKINQVSEGIKQAVINNGGGHLNHSLFWEIMTPDAKKREFKGKIADEIKKTFGSFEKFKEEFSNIAATIFGSGWVWLVADNKERIKIISTKNQDSPLMEGKIPLLGLDVWEHAYYLKYQNKRLEYIGAWWNIINWEKVNELYEKAIKIK